MKTDIQTAGLSLLAENAELRKAYRALLAEHAALIRGQQAIFDSLQQVKSEHAALLAACARVLRAIEWSATEDRMTQEEQAQDLRAAIAKATD